MGKFIERPDFQTAFENIVRVWQEQNMRCETDAEWLEAEKEVSEDARND